MEIAQYQKKFEFLREYGKSATEAYEKCVRFFDQMKEMILIDHGLVHTSNMFHGTAHWFAGQFDLIGDYLHQRHIIQDYGATPEFPETVNELSVFFNMAVDLMEEITEKLGDMIRACDENGCYAIARQLENLQINLSKEYEKYLAAWKMYEETESASSFDNWIAHLNGGDS